jgi:hypothetical protein
LGAKQQTTATADKNAKYKAAIFHSEKDTQQVIGFLILTRA